MTSGAVAVFSFVVTCSLREERVIKGSGKWELAARPRAGEPGTWERRGSVRVRAPDGSGLAAENQKMLGQQAVD